MGGNRKGVIKSAKDIIEDNIIFAIKTFDDEVPTMIPGPSTTVCQETRTCDQDTQDCEAAVNEGTFCDPIPNEQEPRELKVSLRDEDNEDDVFASCILQSLVPSANSYYGAIDDLKFEKVCAFNDEFTWKKGEETLSTECIESQRPSQRFQIAN